MPLTRSARSILGLPLLVFGSALGGAPPIQGVDSYAKPAPTITGFVTTEKVALAVGEAILRGIEGDRYVEMYKPLRARKIEGYWVVDGLAEKRKESYSTFEGVKLAIDPVSCRVAVYGILYDDQIAKALRLRKRDQFSAPKATPKKAGRTVRSRMPSPRSRAS